MREGQTKEIEHWRRTPRRLRPIGGYLVRLESCQQVNLAKPKRFRLRSQWWSSPGRRANQQRASQVPSQRSADSTSASFHGFSFYYIMQVGENLRLFLNTRKKNSHTSPPSPLFGLSHWKALLEERREKLLFLDWVIVISFLVLTVATIARRQEGNSGGDGGGRRGRAIAFLRAALQIPDILSHFTPTGASWAHVRKEMMDSLALTSLCFLWKKREQFYCSKINLSKHFLRGWPEKDKY